MSSDIPNFDLESDGSDVDSEKEASGFGFNVDMWDYEEKYNKALFSTEYEKLFIID